MPALEVYDTVVLKSDLSLVGIVERTHYEAHDTLQDCLIIKHAQVSDLALAEFVNTGVPPKDHAFVRFALEWQGSSLVHYNDLDLLDRSLNLGDVVKKEGSRTLGTVVNVAETYSIQPVWCRSLDTKSIVAVSHATSTKPTSIDPRIILLTDVPGAELKRAEDILEGDYVVKNDWFGMVEELDLAVVVLLENESIVLVQYPDELYTPVPEYNKPLVSLPEFDGVNRPDVLVASAGYSALIPAEGFVTGQFVVTNHRNLKTGRWLKGTYDPTVQPQGRVLDFRCRSVNVKWLVPNAFIPEEVFLNDHSETSSSPKRHQHVYENLSTFTQGSELRRDKQVALVDSARTPRQISDCTRSNRTLMNGSSTLKECSNSSSIAAAEDAQTDHRIYSPTEFRVGDHVRFRDHAGAALKYEASGYERIFPAEMHGFDVNEARIVSSQQRVTVSWQDGSRSKHESRLLTRFNLFEADMTPGDLIVAREGMRQRVLAESNDQSTGLVDYNEMTVFEHECDLLPERVGIIQAVDALERVARVRWYADPKVRLINHGTVLSADSRLGRISDEVEDISLYEIMSFLGLTRKLKDFVIIPPAAPSDKSIAIMEKMAQEGDSKGYGLATLSQLDHGFHSELISYLQHTAAFITRDILPQNTTPHLTYRHRPSKDWIGEIIDISLAGHVTVRLNVGDICRDMIVEHDQLICFVDEAVLGGDLDFHGDSMDVDSTESYSDDMDSASTISETIEYEGGKRIDDDSGDENWEDAEDEVSEGHDGHEDMSDKPRPSQVHPMSEPVAYSSTGAATSPDGIDNTSQPTVFGLLELRSRLSLGEPPSFDILQTDPPSDQYQTRHSLPPSASATFLKRVAKEHRSLSTSLPQNQIYVRTYENRLDLLRCMIIGPPDTPYEFAPFLFDLQLSPNYPQEAPSAHFHSWTSGLGRVNPNLYEEGKICLSLLGTWQGKSETEKWSDKATILQLLVSLQGLVFVKDPFYNEAGFEGRAQESTFQTESQQYTEKAFIMSRAFVKHALSRPIGGMEDVLAWLYLPHDTSVGLLQTVLDHGQALIRNCESMTADRRVHLLDGKGEQANDMRAFLKPLSKGALVHLRKTMKALLELNNSTSPAPAQT